MEAAQRIRSAVDRVSQLRKAGESQPALREAIAAIKRMQSRRFSHTYADLLSGGPYTAASAFFMDELYSDKDYARRDAQFVRIAGAIEKFFPWQVVETAVALAELHALTEELDAALGQAWLCTGAGTDAERYVMVWRAVGQRSRRELQLHKVMEVGRQMIRLTRAPGLRLMLRMMRAPAAAAGMADLQQFLETGFDTFTGLSRRKGAAEDFLAMVQARENALLVLLFEAELVSCVTAMDSALGQAR